MYPEERKARHIDRQVKRMRIYDYQCPKCGSKEERFVDLYLACKEVCKCGIEMNRLPSMFRINVGPVPVTGHYDDNLETFVRTNNHRKEVMLEKGVTEKGATPKTGQAWV